MTYFRDADIALSPPRPNPVQSPTATYGKPSWPYGGYRIDDSGDEWQVMRYLPVTKKWELHLRYPKAQFRVEEDVDAWRVFRGASTPARAQVSESVMDAETETRRAVYRARNIQLRQHLQDRNVAARARWAERAARGWY